MSEKKKRVEEKTPYLNIDLPHEKNELQDDLPGIRQGFQLIDTHAKEIKEELKAFDAAWKTAINSETQDRQESDVAFSEAIRNRVEEVEITANRALAAYAQKTLEQGAHGFSLGQEGQVLTVQNGKLAWGNKYELCEFYYFRHPTLRPGFVPAYGGWVNDAKKKYPAALDYLQSQEGKCLCVSGTEWVEMTRATWATLADGTTIGWNGIGGAPFFSVYSEGNLLRLPDLRGMYVEGAGFDELRVGGVHGDAIRNIQGKMWSSWNTHVGFNHVYSDNDLFSAGDSAGLSGRVTSADSPVGVRLVFNAKNIIPTAAKNQPRAWGALPCVYLGIPQA